MFQHPFLVIVEVIVKVITSKAKLIKVDHWDSIYFYFRQIVLSIYMHKKLKQF